MSLGSISRISTTDESFCKPNTLPENIEERFGCKAAKVFKECLATGSSQPYLKLNNCETLLLMGQTYKIDWLIKESENFISTQLAKLTSLEQKKIWRRSTDLNLPNLQNSFLQNFTISPEQSDALFFEKLSQKVLNNFPLKQFATVNFNPKYILVTLTIENLYLQFANLKTCLQKEDSIYPIYLVIQGNICPNNKLIELELSKNLIGLEMTMDLNMVDPFVTMTKNNSLKYISLHNANGDGAISDAVLPKILNALEHQELLCLHLARFEFIDMSLKALDYFFDTHPALESIAIRETMLHMDFMQTLEDGCVNPLKSISLNQSYLRGADGTVDFLLGSLKSHKSLEQLTLCGLNNPDHLEDYSLQTLCGLIQQTKTIQQIACAETTNDDVFCILKALVPNGSIKTIDFYKGRLENKELIGLIYQQAIEMKIKLTFKNFTLTSNAFDEYNLLKGRNPEASVIFQDLQRDISISSAQR